MTRDPASYPVIARSFFYPRHLCGKLFALLLLLLSYTSLCAQDSSDIVRTNDFLNIKHFKNVEMAFVPREFNMPADLDTIHFTKGLINRGNIRPHYTGKKILLRFYVSNDSTAIKTFYFFPGFFFSKTTLFRVEDGSIKTLPLISPDIKDNVSFLRFDIPPQDTIELLAEVYPVKTYNNKFAPRLIHPMYLEAYVSLLHNSNGTESLITYIFCGLLIMMILFSLASYFLGGSTEFLFYAAYALFLGFMLFTKPYYNLRSYPKTFFYEAYLDFILQCIGICFYMAFMSRFLETRKNYPFLHKLYKYGIWGLCIVMVLFTWLYYGTDNFFLQNFLENYVTKVVLLWMVLVFIVYTIRNWNDKILRYLFWGNVFFLLFSLISLSLILMPAIRQNLPGLFPSSLIYYEMGIFLELLFFLMALTYKNNMQLIIQTKERERLKMENERKEMEKQLAVMAAHQEERNRISADMHDELGSGMTTIRLMSEIAKNKMKEEVPVEIEKISNSANDLLNKMNAIIWSMNSGNDSVDNLVSYIRAYALEYLEGTHIDCKVNTPDYISNLELSGDKRRNIFLCVKETLNNSLKHSGATKMKIDVEVNSKLKIRISDNGKGFSTDHIRQFGSGLKNIARRMESIGGTFSINGDHGTETVLELPL